MTRTIWITAIAAALSASAAVAVPPLIAAAQSEPAGDVIYTCGMHPQIVQHEPGTCPICGMDLTPKKMGGASGPRKTGAPTFERKIKHWVAPMATSTRPGSRSRQASRCSTSIPRSW